MRSLTNKMEQQKNYEYRDSFRWVLTSLGVMLVLSIILAGLVGYKVLFPGKTKYYASMTTGQVIPLPALSEPVVTNDYILQWSALAVRAALNLDFVNYNKQLDAASTYFTDGGWKAFSQALDHSGLLAAVQSKKLMMNAVVPKSPVIRYTGVIHGRYLWRISMPVLVTFGSASDERQRQIDVTLIVSRVSALETPEGIQITHFETK